jgi:predicted nucleic acid-binding protein
MKLIISDSCSLILLEKSKILSVFLDFNDILIPREVYNETIVQGLKLGYLDAKKINEYILLKKIVVKDVKKLINLKINKGEREAISLYLEINAHYLFTDDKKAINICKLKNINYITTPEIIYKLYVLKKISKKKTLTALDIISKEGFYKSEIISHFYKLIVGDK